MDVGRWWWILLLLTLDAARLFITRVQNKRRITKLQSIAVIAVKLLNSFVAYERTLVQKHVFITNRTSNQTHKKYIIISVKIKIQFKKEKQCE